MTFVALLVDYLTVEESTRTAKVIIKTVASAKTEMKPRSIRILPFQTVRGTCAMGGGRNHQEFTAIKLMRAIEYQDRIRHHS